MNTNCVFFLMSVLKNGMYCSLYEVVEKTRIGSNMESLLQKLEKEKLVSYRFSDVPPSSLETCILTSDYDNISVYFIFNVNKHLLSKRQPARCRVQYDK